MSGIYQAILGEIERRDFDVFGETVRVSRPRRAWIAVTHLDADDVPREGSLRRGLARGQPPLRRADVAQWQRRIRHHRHRRRLRRAVGGGPPGRARAAACSCSKRADASAAGPRRSTIARPATASTTASTSSPAAITRRSASSKPSAPRDRVALQAERSTSRSSTAAAGARGCAVRGCRRRGTSPPASSVGTASAGAIACRSPGSAARCGPGRAAGRWRDGRRLAGAPRPDRRG